MTSFTSRSEAMAVTREVRVTIDVVDGPVLDRQFAAQRYVPVRLRLAWRSVDGEPWWLDYCNITGRRVTRNGLGAEIRERISLWGGRDRLEYVPEPLREHVEATKPPRPDSE